MKHLCTFSVQTLSYQSYCINASTFFKFFVFFEIYKKHIQKLIYQSADGPFCSLWQVPSSPLSIRLRDPPGCTVFCWIKICTLTKFAHKYRLSNYKLSARAKTRGAHTQIRFERYPLTPARISRFFQNFPLFSGRQGISTPVRVIILRFFQQAGSARLSGWTFSDFFRQAKSARLSGWTFIDCAVFRICRTCIVSAECTVSAGYA